MEALAAEGIVHRDLALRNVLLFTYEADGDGKVSVKVSDFGLALYLYGGTHQYVAGGPMPLRNMAPESLAKKRFSELSDGNPLPSCLAHFGVEMQPSRGFTHAIFLLL